MFYSVDKVMTGAMWPTIVQTFLIKKQKQNNSVVSILVIIFDWFIIYQAFSR